MVIKRGSTPLKQNQLLSEHEYREARETYGPDAFVAKMGAEAVREGLMNVDLQKQIDQLTIGMTKPKTKKSGKKSANRTNFSTPLSTTRHGPDGLILFWFPATPPDF